MKNLLTLPAPSTARLAGLDLLVFPLDPVLDRTFSNRRWILSLRNAREQLVLLPTLQFMVLLGIKEHTCKCQFPQPDASRAGARTSLQPRQMCY